MTKKIILFILLAACMIMIFLFSSQNAEISGNLSEGITYRIACIFVQDFKTFSTEKQTEIVEGMHFYIRKAAHFSEYALLGMLTFLNACQYFSKTKTRFLITLPFCLLYASADEFHQLFVPGRSGKVIDVLIDSSGALLGVLFLWIIMVVRDRTTKKDKNK